MVPLASIKIILFKKSLWEMDFSNVNQSEKQAETEMV